MTSTPRLLGGALVAAALAAAPASAQTARAQRPATATARTPAVDAVLDRAARAYRGVKSARAPFEQTLTNPLTGTSTVQTGTLFQQGQRWSARFDKPAGDRYVLAGRTLWIYTPSSAPKQALRLSLDPDAVASFDIVQQLAGDPGERFTITDAGAATVSGRATRALHLVPKTPGRLTKATVWVDDRDGVVRQFEITENTGLVRRIRFDSVRFNVAVPASEFTFTPPAGVRVIDQASFSGER
jgi:outer membrane lipoprotein carrier protein